MNTTKAIEIFAIFLHLFSLSFFQRSFPNALLFSSKRLGVNNVKRYVLQFKVVNVSEYSVQELQ